MSDFSGTGVALVTPFDQDGAIDFPALRRLVRHVIDGGLEYLVALGTTGETATLSKAEQLQVLDTIFDENDGTLPVVIGMGSNNTASLIEFAKEIEDKYKPAAFLSVTPYYNKPNQEGLYRHYAAFAKAIKSDIILYNVPGRTAINMLPETTLRLAADFKNIVAIKEASGNMDQCMALVQGVDNNLSIREFQVLSGDDVLGLAQMAIGFEGVISVAANAIPGPFSEMIRLAGAGKMTEARELHYRWMDVMNLHFAEGNPAGVKYSLELLGVCGSTVRLPLAEASEGLRAKLKAAVQKADA
ncbi:MAG: 4-hydroxy-tetrahydrodipicolinate synthase [Bacteroidia bacterium]